MDGRQCFEKIHFRQRKNAEFGGVEI
jgi:hypothetical protein